MADTISDSILNKAPSFLYAVSVHSGADQIGQALVDVVPQDGGG